MGQAPWHRGEPDLPWEIPASGLGGKAFIGFGVRFPLRPATQSERSGETQTLVGILRRRAEDQPSQTVFTFLSDQNGPEKSLTFAGLLTRASTLASRLLEEGLQGERALLLYPAGPEFVEAFFGGLMAGVIAVPASPPRGSRSPDRLAGIAADCSARAALATGTIVRRFGKSPAPLPVLSRLRWIETDDGPEAAGTDRAGLSPSPEALAYLQYTSGSTSEPKGVMVSHANVMANSEEIRRGFAHTSESRSLCWLPHFHDMGLVDGILQPVYAGFPAILMSPAAFLQEPGSWLDAISRHRITHSGGPNFAYDLCVRRADPDPSRWDLGSWAVAYNGAEPVRAETLERFASRFSACGFRRESFYPAYGLAEATLKVSGGSRGDGPTVRRVGAAALEAGRVEDDPAGRPLVGSGGVGAGTIAVIVDPDAGAPAPEGRTGEIWVSGPSVALGYWNRAEESERVFRARLPGREERFLRTGDLGFQREGEIFVTGRLKDLIIIRGRNLHPQDLERTAEASHPALRPGAGAAFAVEAAGEERLVIVHEVDRHSPGEGREVLDALRSAILDAHDVAPFAVALVRPGGVPRTSSGKVRRSACRSTFLQGALPVVAEWRSAGPGEEPAPETGPGDPRAWLAGRLARKLGIPAESVDFGASLARLGLDSLRSTELAYEIGRRFGAALTTADLLSAESVSEIAAMLEAQGAPRAPEAPAGTDPEESPLSRGQQAIWFLQELAPESAAYTIAAALRLTGPLDEAALERALRALIARHPSLRARIIGGRGGPRQRFDVGFDAIYSLSDLGSLPPEGLPARLAGEAYAPFNLAEGPLFRASLLRDGGSRILLISCHHLIADLWSLSVVLRDLRELYAAALGLEEPPAPSGVHPAEFVRWQAQKIDSPSGRRQLEHWRGVLSGNLPALELPADRPRPASQTFAGGARTLELDPDLTAALRRLAREKGVTLYTLLVAAYQALLHRLTGQRVILVGSPASGRTLPRFEGLVAYLVNTVVLRAEFAGDPTFDSHLAATREGVLGAIRNQDYPFAGLVKMLAPQRDPSRSPVVDTLFDFHGVGDLVRGDLAAAGGPGRTRLAGGVEAEPLAVERRGAQVDLSATVTDDGRALRIELEYNSDLFDAGTVDRLARQFATLLSGVAAAPGERVSRLPLLSAPERAALLRGANARPGTDRVEPVHRLFEREAARHPLSAAALHAGATLTYGELNRRANALAGKLRSLGVGPESRVAVALPKSFDLLAALLGVLKAGGAYVPIDPTLPAARKRLMASDSGAGVVVTSSGLAGEFAPGLPRVIAGEIPGLAERFGGEDLEGDPAPHNLAYVIYTSGTSGTPKGVAVSHASLFGAFRAWEEAYDLRSLSTHLQMAAPGFDVFTGDLVRALCSGGALLLVDRDLLLDPPALASLARLHGAEFTDVVPAALRELAGHLTRAGERLDSFKVVAVGADVWSMADYELFRRAFGEKTRLLNSYGVTEATIDSTLDDVDGDGGRPVPAIGRPLANSAAYVLDARLEPLPAGIRGELCLGGPAVARGYIGRPDLTAERFQPDPHGEPGSRLYRTGDAARLLPDGRIEFIGRRDSQVKIRGYRVEPAEVEAVLKTHPAVSACAVVAHEHPNGPRLAAYAALHRDSGADAGALRSHLAERLPDYMVPSAVIVLDALPLSLNGKIDRRALPPPDTREERPARHAAAATPAEQALREIWGQVLQVDRVGPDDNFFELGGDSILSIQVVARARESGLRVTPRMLFEHPTPSGLARVAEPPEPAVPSAAWAGEAPLLPMQEWFFEQRFEEASPWNMAMALDTRETLDLECARRAAAALLEHHDALRARFERSGSGWRQVIPAAGTSKAEVRWVETAGGELREEAVARCCRLLAEGLDIGRSPLIAFGIVADGPRKRTTLVVAAHHLVVDGVSLRLLAEDFERGYRQARRGEPVRLPPKTAPAARWATALAEAVRSGRLDHEVDHWKGLAGSSAPALPLDGREAAPLEETTSYARIELDERETEELRRAAIAEGERLENVLLAALVSSCGSWTGGAGLVVELEGHGRDLVPDLDVSRTVGWFTQTHPVRIDGIDPLDFPATLEAVRRAREGAPGDGFETLRRHSADPGAREALGRVPAPPISFNYLGRFDAAPGPDSLFTALREPSSPQRSPRARRTHVLEIDAGIVDRRLSVRWSTSRAQLDEATVRRLAGDFRRALKAFAARLAPGPEIEAVLPLTPMQEGMLFHHLRDGGRDPYVTQVALELTGDVDPGLLGRAWQLAADWHPALRAEFAWEGRERPVQVIRRVVELPVRVREGAENALEEVLAGARSPGFELSLAPLARIDLVRTRPDRLVCAFTHHHILLDGWSLPLVLGTVFGLYESLASGERVPEPGATALRGYASWLSTRDLGAAERFFTGYLAGFAAPTPLPDPGGPRGGDEGIRVVHEDAPAEVERRARALGLTPGTVIQAAWALVLAACSGERDVLFGATSSGRPPEVEGIESLAGLFINTLPVRARIDFQIPALEWMRSLQRAGAGLRQHEYAPLALIQRCAAIPPNAPLFESVLVFENYPIDIAALGRRKHFRVTSTSLHEETNYPLTIVAEQEGGLRLRAIARSSRYDEPAARAVLRRLAAAMEDLLSRPEAALGEVSVLPEEERRRVLVAWNDTRRPYPREAGIPEVFDSVARERGDGVALAFDGGEMTYSELRDRSLAAAATLRARGIGEGSRVALAMERSPGLIVAILGVLRAGGAYVPVDPESPSARTSRMLEDTGASLLVSDGPAPVELPGGTVSFRELEAGAGPGAPLPPCRAESLAYVMFTSGSTGAPKGIEVTHRNVLRLVLGSEYARLGPGETILQLAPVAFDASTFEIWGALLRGGRLAIAPRGVASTSEIARLLKRHSVTTLWLTAGIFHLMVDEEVASLAAVGQVIAGGDVLDPSRVRRLLASGCRRVVNGYGPTETTTFACCDVLDDADAIGERVPIGRPVANARVYVLDERMAPVPVGAPGELFVGGDGVSRGYARRADLTAARFVPDPFEGDGSRLYRTGDLVRWRPDGRIEFLGRRDGQVKVRGFRVELGEVEAALARAPGVRAAAVAARPDGESKELVGYVVWEGPGEGDLGALRGALAGRLPPYMIPSRLVVLDTLPLNANGKVDRGGLPAPDAAIRPPRTARPLTPVEGAVADLWRRVLGVEGIGPEDDFFELGGHSLQAVRLLAALRRAFRVDLPMTAFYETSTVEGVARALIAHQPAEGHVERAARALAKLRSMTPDQARSVLASRREGVRTL